VRGSFGVGTDGGCVGDDVAVVVVVNSVVVAEVAVCVVGKVVAECVTFGGVDVGGAVFMVGLL